MKKIKKSIFVTLAVSIFFCYGLINTASAANYTESESNNTTGTANSISQSSVVTASLTSGDIDYYKFTPTTSGIYKIYTSSSIDTKGVLYKGTSTEMISNDDGGSNYNFQICAYLSSGTTYYVKVTGYSTSTTGNYTLYVASTTTYTDLGWQYMFRSSQMATTLSDTYRTGHYAVDIVDRNSSGTNICGGYKMIRVSKPA